MGEDYPANPARATGHESPEPIPKICLLSRCKAPDHQKAIVIGNDQIFDFSVPQASIISLKKFLKRSVEIVVVKLKSRPEGLEKNLQEFAKQRVGEPFKLNFMGGALARFLMRQYFCIPVTGEDKNVFKRIFRELVTEGHEFLNCTSSFIQAWFKYVPGIEEAYLAEPGFYEYIPLGPDHPLVSQEKLARFSH